MARFLYSSRPSMAHSFPSQAWADAFRDAINASARYAETGRDWTHGAVALVVRADPALGIERDMAIVVDAHEGRCRSASYGDAESARAAAPFVIEGLYDRWQALLREGGDPIKALMQGKLKMTKGHLPTLIRFVESSKAMLASAQAVPSEFRA
jgi:putative sterol carrier protein